MKKFRYSVSTNTIWTSFDYGEVEAENMEKARQKALEQLAYNFQKANDVLDHAEITQGFKVDFDKTQIQIEET